MFKGGPEVFLSSHGEGSRIANKARKAGNEIGAVPVEKNRETPLFGYHGLGKFFVGIATGCKAIGMEGKVFAEDVVEQEARGRQGAILFGETGHDPGLLQRTDGRKKGGIENDLKQEQGCRQAVRVKRFR